MIWLPYEDCYLSLAIESASLIHLYIGKEKCVRCSYEIYLYKASLPIRGHNLNVVMKFACYSCEDRVSVFVSVNYDYCPNEYSVIFVCCN